MMLDKFDGSRVMIKHGKVKTIREAKPTGYLSNGQGHQPEVVHVDLEVH